MTEDGRRNRVLFVCVENCNRSQMAEAFARTFGPGRVEAYSAGCRPGGAPRAVSRSRSERREVSPTGVERDGAIDRPPKDLRNTDRERAAESGALCGEGPDLDLQAVVAAWPTLPPAVRFEVLALVRTAHVSV